MVGKIAHGLTPAVRRKQQIVKPIGMSAAMLQQPVTKKSPDKQSLGRHWITVYDKKAGRQIFVNPATGMTANTDPNPVQG